jgi:hypothetical protein
VLRITDRLNSEPWRAATRSVPAAIFQRTYYLEPEKVGRQRNGQLCQRNSDKEKGRDEPAFLDFKPAAYRELSPLAAPPTLICFARTVSAFGS